MSRGVLLAVAPAVGLLVCAGCSSDGAAPPMDAGAMPRDATVVDATGFPDAGRVDARIGADGHADVGAEGGSAECLIEPCDPRAQEACGIASRCALGAEGPHCVAAVSEGELGAPCTTTDGCRAGLGCFRGADGGVCARICCPGDPSSCREEESCEGAPLVDGTTTGWGRCLGPRTCHVLMPLETCGLGKACYITSGSGETACLDSGDRDVGEPCNRQNDCAPGLSCTGQDNPTCKRICSIADEEPRCLSGEGECVVYAQSPEGTGLCTR